MENKFNSYAINITKVRQTFYVLLHPCVIKRNNPSATGLLLLRLMTQ